MRRQGAPGSDFTLTLLFEGERLSYLIEYRYTGATNASVVHSHVNPHSPCNIPFRLRRVQHIDFTADYDSGVGDT